MGAKRKLTREQKEWIKARDGHKCVLCGSTRNLEVHHIIGHALQHYVVNGEEVPETPLNLVTVCHKCHTLSRDDARAIHPDMSYALHRYHDDPGIIDKVFRRRRKKLRREIKDKPLWNHEHDYKLQQHAIYATLDYIAQGHKWPTGKKKKRKKK